MMESQIEGKLWIDRESQLEGWTDLAREEDGAFNDVSEGNSSSGLDFCGPHCFNNQQVHGQEMQTESLTGAKEVFPCFLWT